MSATEYAMYKHSKTPKQSENVWQRTTHHPSMHRLISIHLTPMAILSTQIERNAIAHYAQHNLYHQAYEEVFLPKLPTMTANNIILPTLKTTRSFLSFHLQCL